MTTPVSNINRSNLNLLDPNLATGQVADPALRKTCFDEIYNYFDTFVTAYNLFIANGGIVTANIADLAVTTAKLALGAVTAAQIASGTITTNQIASGAVTSANILDGTLVDADINATAAIAWSKVNKALSSLADLATRSATDLNSGTLNAARLPTAIPATNIGNGDVTNAILSFLNSLSSNVQTQLDAKVPLSQKGAASGVASLDSGARVPIAQLPDAVLGALEYQGSWNASANTPTLTASPTTIKGYYYIVSVAGTQFSISFDVGDWIVSNGTIWQKIDNTDAVPSVFGRTGAISAATNDYTWAQIDKTVSSLLDLATRSASDLSSGTLADARRNARTGDVTSPLGSGVNTIAALAVTTAKIADLNVTTAKIADLNVTTGKIADLGVTTAKINDLGVTTGKVADGAITSAKLDPSINVAGIPLSTHIATSPIDHPDGSVTNAKIATGIDAAKLADGSVSNTKLQYINSVTSNVQTQLDSKVDIVPATLVVAASNSKNTAKADYVCTGTNDQTTINTAIAALPVITVENGTAQAGAASTVTLASGANAVDNYYTGYTITTTGGTGSGQSRAIAGYVGSTKVATTISAWGTNPDATTTYNITTPSGKVILLEGLFSIAAAITVPNNVSLEGQGNGTLLKIPNTNNTTFNVIQNADQTNGNGSISISKLKLDGNKANNTAGTQVGISFTKTYSSTIQNVTVVNTRNDGVKLTTSNNNALISNYLSSSGAGINIVSGNYNFITGNTCKNNSGDGIFNSGINNMVTENICQANAGHGITFSGSNTNIAERNICQGNANNGITINSSNNIVAGNTCQGNGAHGLQLLGGNGNSIVNNICLENSQTTTNTSDNINADNSASTNNIQGNTCRKGALTNLPRYGIRINVSTNTGNLVANNDLTLGGSTSAYSDAGTSTITTGAGNKLA
jgi:parallel beta-helix repeat protein